MKPTTEGSSVINFDILCISFGKDKDRGLKVVQGASKNLIFDEEMSIKAEDCTLRKNNTLETVSGNIITLNDKAFETVQENRKTRKTKSKKVSRTDREIR